MIVRWGLDELGPILAELRCDRPLLVTTRRFELADVPVELRFAGVRPHVPTETVAAGVEAAAAADGLVALGGGSAIDTGKAVSAATGLLLVAVPTTYAGAEWTTYFGVRDEARRVKGGGSGANVVAVVYEPRLTLGLPRAETVGTALNALAHAAEALYGGPHADAVAGTRAIGSFLPRVAENGDDLETRTRLLEGAMHAGKALAERGLFLAHAIAQTLGGRYGLPHGAMNALCLPPALRFNEPAVPEAIALLCDALEAEDAAERVVALARLGGFRQLRDFGVPEDDLPELAQDAASRPGARANPRPVTAAEAFDLLRSVW